MEPIPIYLVPAASKGLSTCELCTRTQTPMFLVERTGTVLVCKHLRRNMLIDCRDANGYYVLDNPDGTLVQVGTI